jgi:hypothetical protein
MEIKTYPNDIDFLEDLVAVISNLTENGGKSKQEEYALERLISLYQIAIGKRKLEANKKTYSDVIRTLDEIGLTQTQLGKDFIDLHDYFAEHYTIPTKQ